MTCPSGEGVVMHAGRMGLTVLALLLTTLAFASVEPNWYSSEKFTRATAASSYPASSAAEEAFRALRGGSIQSLNSDHRPILIHTRQKSQDTVVFVRSDNTSFDIPICPPGYLDLQAIGHIPVSVVYALAQDNGTYLSDVTNRTLEDLMNLTQALLSTVDKQSLQSDILITTSLFISKLFSRGVQSSDDTGRYIRSLTDQLKGIARKAVMVYLVYLNETITRLLQNGTITGAEFNSMYVAIALAPFIESQSYLAQYYTALLSLQLPTTPTQRERLLLLYQYWDSQSCSSVPSTDLLNTSICAWSSTFLRQNISWAFYGDFSSSVHLLLSQAARDVICSDLYFPLCTSTGGRGLPGFESRTQRAYVVTIIYLIMTLIVLTVILFALCKEGEKMKSERRMALKSQILLNAHTGDDYM